MNEIIQILMKRDNIDEIEAQCVVEGCIEELQEIVRFGNIVEAEECVYDWLGLEPDYLDILLNQM